MPHCTNQVCNQIRTKSDISGALAASWGRMINKLGRGRITDKLDISKATIARALGGDHLPAFDTAMNALALDITALDEVLALYGLRACPIAHCPADDERTRVKLAHIPAEWLQLGPSRDHRDTIRLADEMRDVIPAMLAVIFQADSIRGRA